MPPTKENVSYAKKIQEAEKMRGNHFALIINNGGKLEFVPEKSIGAIKLMLPDLKVL